MRCQMLNSSSFGAVLHHMPYDPLCYEVLPARQTQRNTRPSVTSADTSQESIALLTQSGTGTGPNMPGLADQIDDGPVVFTPLKISKIWLRRLFTAQPATQENAEKRPVTFAL